MKKKTVYERPTVELVIHSPEAGVCTVSGFNGFGSEENWDDGAMISGFSGFGPETNWDN